MSDQTAHVIAQPGKYLTFELAGEHYGLEVLRVAEIVGYMPVTRVPRLPAFVAGVVNLRGRIIPVVDLRLSFGLPATAMTERTCIVVASVLRDSAEIVMGVIVDEVSDVIYLSAEQIEHTPEFGVDLDTSFVKGVGRTTERVVLLLDIDQALSGTQLELVRQAGEEPAASAPDSSSLDSEGDQPSETKRKGRAKRKA